jgi:hypothetical protein
VIDDMGTVSWSVRDETQLEETLRHLRQGAAFGYPLCCVLAFCWDNLEGRHPALRRSDYFPAPSGEGTYVGCRRCIDERRAKLRALHAHLDT